MFKNSGGKLKGLAKFIFVLIIVLASLSAVGLVINAVMMFTQYNDPAQGGILIATASIVVIIGIIVAWLSSIMTYAIGELVEDNQKMREMFEFTLLGHRAPKPESSDYFDNTQRNDAGYASVVSSASPVSEHTAKSYEIQESEKAGAETAVVNDTNIENMESGYMETEEEKTDSEQDDLVKEKNEKAFPDGWECANCGSRNSSLVNTCMSCGEKKGTVVKKGCPNCGTQPRPGEMFCRNCGTRL